MTRIFWALVVSVFASMVFPANGLTDYWLIGFGGEYMIPFLDGGVLEYGVGESLVVKLVGRDGYVTLVSPTGLAERISVVDGQKTVLKRFGLGDVGEWTLTVDEGMETRVVVRPPVVRPAVTVSFRLEDSQMVMTAETIDNSFALFLEGRSQFVKAAGSTMTISVSDLNETRVRAEIVRSGPTVRYSGSLDGVGYGLEIEQVVTSEIVVGRLVDGSMVFSVKIPDEDEKVSGLKPVGIGFHKIRLLSLTDRRIIYEANVLVVPSSRRGLEGLSHSLVVDFWEALKNNYTLLVGDEAGNLWQIKLRPPAVVFRIYDTEHGRFHDDAELIIPDGKTRKADSQLIATFLDSYEIDDYINQSFFIPSKELAATVSFGASRLTTPVLSIRAGDIIWLNFSLYRAELKLVFPNGTAYRGPRIVEINGETFTDDSALFLPRGIYTARALRPESFSYETRELTTDTTWTIIVLDNPLGLAGLRASSILLTALLAYTFIKTFTMRKTFNRPFRHKVERS